MLDWRCGTEKATDSQIAAPNLWDLVSLTGRHSLSRRSISLRHEKNFAGVGILHFRARREPFHINIFARREWTLHDVRLSGNGNSVGMIAPGGATRRRRRCGGGHWRRHFWCWCGGTGCVWIKGLLLGWVRRRLVDRISREPMARRRRFLLATRNEEAGEQENR